MKPIVIDDLLDYKFPENLLYSPSGKYLAFQVAKANKEKNNYTRDIWIKKNGKAKQFTYSINCSILCWDNDDNLIVNKVIDNNSGTSLYKLNVNGGEALPFLQLPFKLTIIKKVKDNLYVACGVIDGNDPDAYKDSEELRNLKKAAKEKDKDYTVIDEVPYWHNNQGFTNKNRNALFTIDTSNGLDIKRITKPMESVQSFIIEGNDVYYLSETHTLMESRYNDISILHLDNNKVEKLYSKKDYVFRNIFFIGHKLYGMAANLQDYGLNQTPDFVSVEKNKLTFIKDPHRRLGASTGSDAMLGSGKQQEIVNNNIYSLVTDVDRVEIWKFDKNFASEVLFDKPGVCFFMDACKDKLAFAYANSSGPSEIYEANLDGSGVKCITHLNKDVMKEKYVATPKAIKYKSDGIDLNGWVLEPINYNSKKKYPAILDIHGGPRSIYSTNFFHEMQVWASKGYFVFFTNIRGSDGRDDDFADIRGKYGSVDYENLMDFTDAVLKKYPSIDTKKVCVTGGSYGGFMTNWIIGHTNRFAAAASQRSIASWISLTFIADIGLWYDPGECGLEVDESLFDGFERMWKSSPLKYIKGAKTPTLFIHSDQDYRCPLPEGMQMMQALAFQNVETRMCIFHGENHELSRSGKPLHRLRRLQEISDWFDKHTGDSHGKK